MSTVWRNTTAGPDVTQKMRSFANTYATFVREPSLLSQGRKSMKSIILKRSHTNVWTARPHLWTAGVWRDTLETKCAIPTCPSKGREDQHEGSFDWICLGLNPYRVWENGKCKPFILCCSDILVATSRKMNFDIICLDNFISTFHLTLFDFSEALQLSMRGGPEVWGMDLSRAWNYIRGPKRPLVSLPRRKHLCVSVSM